MNPVHSSSWYGRHHDHVVQSCLRWLFVAGAGQIYDNAIGNIGKRAKSIKSAFFIMNVYVALLFLMVLSKAGGH